MTPVSLLPKALTNRGSGGPWTPKRVPTTTTILKKVLS